MGKERLIDPISEWESSIDSWRVIIFFSLLPMYLVLGVSTLTFMISLYFYLHLL